MAIISKLLIYLSHDYAAVPDKKGKQIYVYLWNEKLCTDILMKQTFQKLNLMLRRLLLDKLNKL